MGKGEGEREQEEAGEGEREEEDQDRREDMASNRLYSLTDYVALTIN